MPRPSGRRHREVMSGSSSPARFDQGEVAALFLVEMLAPGLETGGALRMAGALQHAAARLRLAKTHVAWRGGLLVPGQSRCLYLLDAESDQAVRQVRDVAGLATATIHRVTPLLIPTTARVLPAAAPSGPLGEDTGASDALDGPG